MENMAGQSVEGQHSPGVGSDGDEDTLSDSQQSRSSEEAEIGEFPLTQVEEACTAV